MIERYFVYNGKRCEYGEIVKIKYGDEIASATFIAYNTDRNSYTFKLYNKRYKDGSFYTSYSKENFKKVFVEFTGEMDSIQLNEIPLECMLGTRKITFTEELQTEGMALAWIWYIFLMGITLFFNGQIFYWAFISFIFFDYRKKKLK